MSTLIALDIAILPPPDVGQRAVHWSATLPGEESQGLRLDADHRPHITLTQQFVRMDELDAMFERVDEALRGQPPLIIHVTGGGFVGRAFTARRQSAAGGHSRSGESFRARRPPSGRETEGRR